MKINMGKTDQIIRIFVAAIIAFLYFIDIISGTFAVVLMTFVSILVITSFIGFCPLYVPFGLNTRHKRKRIEKRKL